MDASPSAEAPACPKDVKPTNLQAETPRSKPPKPNGTKLKEPKSEPEPEPEPYIKPDPDEPQFLSEHSLGRRPRVKPEPQEDSTVTIDLTSVPDAGDDMFEDVDADEIVDLTYEGIAHVNGVRHFVCEGFKIRQIPEPFIVKRSLFDLFQCIEAKSIILDPEYQRDVVWDEVRAALLITSILMGYFIPPIIFNVKKSTHKIEGRDEIKYTRICVDGKQRLTSIWKFLKGQIGFHDNNQPQRKWFYCHQIIDGRLQVQTRNILPNAVKDFFKKQFFCCYEYEELDLDTEETMFQLVQRGIALTPAEKMRALSTEWAMYTKQFEDDYALVVNLSKQNRASGFRLVLTIFTMILEVIAGKRKKTTTDAPTLQASPQALSRLLEDRRPIEPELKEKLKSTFERYEGLVKLSSTQIATTRWKIKPNSVFDPAPEYLRTANVNWVRTFSPLELIVTAILIHIHMDHRSDEELLEDIRTMRKYLRTYHKDLRVNSQCWNSAWNYITVEMDARRGIIREPRQPGEMEVGFGTDARRPVNEAAALRLGRSGATIRVSSGSRKRGVKRRPARRGDGDDVEEENSSDLSELTSTDDESDESDGIVFEGLMSPGAKARKEAADKAKAKAKKKADAEKAKNARSKGVGKGSTKSRGGPKAGSKRSGGLSSNGRSSALAKRPRRA